MADYNPEEMKALGYLFNFIREIGEGNMTIEGYRISNQKYLRLKFSLPVSTKRH